jgi:hypothetical protein
MVILVTIVTVVTWEISSHQNNFVVTGTIRKGQIVAKNCCAMPTFPKFMLMVNEKYWHKV